MVGDGLGVAIKLGSPLGGGLSGGEEIIGANRRITEDSNVRITEDGNTRITEN